MNVLRSAILIGLVSLVGCATTDELEAVKTSMRALLGTTKQSLERSHSAGLDREILRGYVLISER